jgi:hypothetical protein
MHSPTLLLLLLQVLGSVIIFGDAFVMSQKKLPLQKDTHHRIILSGVSSDDDEGGISYEAILESREREIELIARLDPDHEQNDSSLSDHANQEIVISELWVSSSADEHHSRMCAAEMIFSLSLCIFTANMVRRKRYYK